MKNLYQYLTEAKIDDLKKKWENKLSFGHDYDMVQEYSSHYYTLMDIHEYIKHNPSVGDKFIDDFYRKNNLASYWDDPVKKQAGLEARHLIIDEINRNDPHPNKAYSDWIAKRYHSGDFSYEDIDGSDYTESNVKPIIDTFHENKHRLPVNKRNINSFKDYNELRDTVTPFIKIDKSNLIEEPQDLKKEAPLIYNDNGIKVYHPLTKEASCSLGGSTWCTSNMDKRKNYFDNKNSQGPFYIVHLENEESPYKKIGIHPATREFQDQNNHNIVSKGRLKEFIDRNPELLKTPLKDHIKGLLK